MKKSSEKPQQFTDVPAGQIFSSLEPRAISAVLTNTVAVCVFSRPEGAGGIAHFSADSPGAIAQLIAQIQNKNSFKKDIKLNAKIVGGSKCKEQEIKEVRSILAEANVPIIGEDVGGEREREIRFYTDSGRLQVAYLDPAAQTSKSQKKKVLIVDDSKTICEILSRVLSKDPHLDVVGVTSKPFEAEQMIEKLDPDIVTLDLRMPEMDGVTFLERQLSKKARPFLVISALSMQEGNEVLRALELGAVDYMQKPTYDEIANTGDVICEKVRTAASVNPELIDSNRRRMRSKTERSLDVKNLNISKVIAMGASTGGVEALRAVLTQLPAEIPPIVIVQHIPPVFSRSLANRFNTLCKFRVKEAEDGDRLEPGLALIAPGGMQMKVAANGFHYQVRIVDDPPVHSCKPSVDVLFDSVAETLGPSAIGVIFTGMGEDGAAGLLKMRRAGARTIAQNQESCVVFGMPQEAIRLGAAEQIYGLDEIPEALVNLLKSKKLKSA